MMLIKFSRNSNWFKFFLFLFILGLFFLTISSSSAMNNVSNIREVVGNTPDGGELLLDQGIYEKPGDRNISLDKEITIYALEPETVIIDLEQSCNFINITSGGNLTLINLTFINGNMSNGGVISNQGGTLNIINCTFINNVASGFGGAIYNNNSSITTIHGSYFLNNVANNGAAINVEDNAVLNVFNSTFINNTANNGAIISNYQNRGVVNNLAIKSSVFYNNTGNHLIYSNNMPNLDDNFYFWVLDSNNPNHTSLTTMISDAINDLSYIGSYYYIQLSYNPAVVLGNDLELIYSMKHNQGANLDDLAVTNITLKVGSGNNNVFKFNEDYQKLSLDVSGNDLITLNYFGSSFYNIVYTVVKLDIPTLTLVGEGNQQVGDIYTLIATVTGNGPIVGGEVIFYLNNKEIGRNITNSEGVAFWHHSFTNKGNHVFSAKFIGNGNYTESTVALNLLIVDEKPNNSNNNSNTNSNNNSNNHLNDEYYGVYASMKKTGIPIIALLLVVSCSFALIARKNQ